MRSAYLHCIINKTDKLLFFFLGWNKQEEGEGRGSGWLGLRRGVWRIRRKRKKREIFADTLWISAWQLRTMRKASNYLESFPLSRHRKYIPAWAFFLVSPSLPCPPSFPLSPSPSLVPPCISNLILRGRQGRCNKERRVCVTGRSCGRTKPCSTASVLQPPPQQLWKMSRKVFYSSNSSTNSSQIKRCEY